MRHATARAACRSVRFSAYCNTDTNANRAGDTPRRPSTGNQSVKSSSRNRSGNTRWELARADGRPSGRPTGTAGGTTGDTTAAVMAPNPQVARLLATGPRGRRQGGQVPSTTSTSNQADVLCDRVRGATQTITQPTAVVAAMLPLT